MALVEKRVCDIYGTQSKVSSVKVRIEVDDVEVKCVEMDMSRMARDRLMRFIDRATTKPNSEAKTE